MAAVTLPPIAPPQPEAPKRRPWLIAVVVAWILVVAGLGWWAVTNDPPTVPEQRDLADALPILQRATGAVLAAADGDDRVVRLGDLQISDDCSLTPVRGGVEASRDVTVYVQADRALAALQAIVAALPPDYAAESGSSSGGRRIGLTADAGGFVAIDAAADAGPQVLQVRVPPGCRPAPEAAAPGVAVSSGQLPVSLERTLEALRGNPGGVTANEVTCPDGSAARTYTVDGVPAPADLGGSLQQVVAGATVVRGEPAGWAWRAGSDSVAVDKQDGTVRVSVTTACA